jgi:long-subunit acyl-CoA synthetase (AMP-forming)
MIFQFTISNLSHLQDFSVPGGELGPTLKMKRHVVLEKNLMEVEKFYT